MSLPVYSGKLHSSTCFSTRLYPFRDKGSLILVNLAPYLAPNQVRPLVIDLFSRHFHDPISLLLLLLFLPPPPTKSHLNHQATNSQLSHLLNRASTPSDTPDFTHLSRASELNHFLQTPQHNRQGQWHNEGSPTLLSSQLALLSLPRLCQSRPPFPSFLFSGVEFSGILTCLYCSTSVVLVTTSFLVNNGFLVPS